jgi:hypothetical protein
MQPKVALRLVFICTKCNHPHHKCNRSHHECNPHPHTHYTTLHYSIIFCHLTPTSRTYPNNNMPRLQTNYMPVLSRVLLKLEIGAHCESFCRCHLRPQWGDYHLGWDCHIGPQKGDEAPRTHCDAPPDTCYTWTVDNTWLCSTASFWKILEVLSILEIFHFLPFPTGSISGFIHGNGTEISGYELWEFYSTIYELWEFYSKPCRW